MANSTHSIGFRRLMDAVLKNVSEPLQSRLFDTWITGEDTPDAGRQIATDLLLIATSLHVKKQSLTHGQYAFLGDLYDHCLHKERGDTVDQHKKRLIDLVTENEFYWEPPISSLNLLRGYDAVSKTTVAPMYKDLLLKIVTVTLTHVEKPTAVDNQILSDYEQLWTEIVTATRTPAKRVHPDSSPLIADINRAVLELVVPAREVIKAVDELQRMPGLKDTEGFIRKSFTNYCAQAILADSHVDQKELELFHDLAPTLMFFGKQGSIQNLQEAFQRASKNIEPNETPLLVSILDMYDRSMHTELGARARSLYFRLANTAFKADLTVSADELEWLEKFKDTLYPHETLERVEKLVSEDGIEKLPDRPVFGNISVEQSLEELNASVGLERVKQDMAQLVNFIKVQQMREQKGLPGSGIPKHFVFCGNPGTGKTSVARILSNIYKALGIFKKGQIVQASRADLVVEGHPGKSAVKVKDSSFAAIGGVLFIDEANELLQEGVQDPQGKEAVETLVKAIEDRPETIVVILAGQQDKLERFLNSNTALKTRFNKAFYFDDYSPEQMLEIFQSFCNRAAFQTSPEVLRLVKSIFEQIHAERSGGFGNAKEVRRIFESIIGNQANRIIALLPVNEEILSTITEDDVQPLLAALSVRQ
ncbi:AAA family ATPase [Candidatus Obscuribacterales bacterium]|nr:AAA family ATPase [Candidatus Obscuribacterales bacterium]